MNIKSIARSSIITLLVNRFQKNLIPGESRNMNIKSLDQLTQKEQRLVIDTWGMKDFTYHRMFKTHVSFDSRYVSDYSFFPEILRALNPYESANSFERKSLYGILFHGIPQPKSIACCIDGTYIVNDKFVSREEVVNVLKSKEKCIIKPTGQSTQGRNVQLFNIYQSNADDVLKKYESMGGGNFIAQEVLSQSPRTAVFNETSLNTFRITTLNINSRVSLCNILFRCGQGNSIVDNGGAGGLMIGVMPNGRYMDFAYDKYYNKHTKTKNGVEFKGKCIEEMPQIINQVIGWHTTYLPHMGIVGWDIALNEKEEPIMIEVNLRLPGIQFEQLCSETPLFGDRTDEVIKWTKSHKLRISDLLYE